MNFIDGHGLVIVFAAGLHPLSVRPSKTVQTPDTAGSGRADFCIITKRICVVKQPFFCLDAVFIHLTILRTGHKNCPKSLICTIHFPSVPVGKFPNEKDILCIWCVNSKPHALLGIFICMMRTKCAVGFAALSL